MDMKEIRKKSGLSQKKFAEKYGLPYRSVENWEEGSRKPPDYVLDLLNFRVETDLVLKMGYVFFDIPNDAKEIVIFNDEETAVNYAIEKWENLPEDQKKEYKLNEGSIFSVAFCPLKWAGEKYLPDREALDIFWSAI